MKDLTIQLFDYHVWANEKLIRHLKSLPIEIFTNKVDSVFPTIAEIFSHILAVDELWFLRIKEENLKKMLALV